MASCLVGEKPGFLSSLHNGVDKNGVDEKPAHSFSPPGSRACVCVGMREGFPVNLEPPLGSRLCVLVCDFCLSLR